MITGYAIVAAKSVSGIVLLLPLLLFARPGDRRNVGLFLLFGALNILALVSFAFWVHVPGLNWNWGGKLLAIVVSAVFLARSPRLAQECKLTLAQRPGTYRVAFPVFLILVGITAALSPLRTKVPFSIESLLFQLTLPNLDEEVAYRGIELALLDRVFPRRFRLFGAEFGWGLVIVALLFGHIHAVWINADLSYFVHPVPFLLIGINGFLFGLLAEGTGSLLLPMAAHITVNVLGTLLAAWRP